MILSLQNNSNIVTVEILLCRSIFLVNV